MEKKLEIAHFTDPLCFWCYAMEPEMRKVRVLLDDQLDYRIVMGVLSSSIHEIIGDGVDADLRFEFYRAMLSNYIRQAAEAVGMPITVDNMMECNPEELISLPLSLAYCAMKMIDEGIAEAYLRRMRECIFAEGRSLATIDDQVELASEFPIDIAQLREHRERRSRSRLAGRCRRMPSPRRDGLPHLAVAVRREPHFDTRLSQLRGAQGSHHVRHGWRHHLERRGVLDRCARNVCGPVRQSSCP